MSESNETLIYCSFCGLNHKEVGAIIASPHSNICNNCVVICVQELSKKLQEYALPLLQEQDK